MAKSFSESEDKDELVIHISGGETRVDFFSVEHSEFIIKYVLSKEERERMAQTDCRRIYCG